ncbi:Pimeloyl-ACP methyl ester carboxylesterase [Amycolatopsis pretoriensis]|uniref:Pimeloyl-ACP methyl ester carboxylesterase n=1 Tax=Amycolatopsis pretoriensis TaxID=218821 RepID=A0A1H5R111_9PSEU|nr:alpha/beta hydrolase [Amycolatopsis pretoriensis]SEF32082.1 Pimeloyl-ACP methyl ester carboxylesterase [Amycolatopsis pretoriensis]
MPIFSAPDGTALSFRLLGSGGEPVVCLPGGPMRAGAYLGDLGGLDRLAVLDLRGTGDSDVPADPGTYRCDRQVEDVEALRKHLGLDRFDLLGHSAGASLAVLYAARYPGRLRRLVLVAPSPRAVGLQLSVDDRRRIMARRAGAPWFEAAAAAYDAIAERRATSGDWAAVAPMYYGRWDEAAQRHQALEPGQRNGVAARLYNAEGAFEPSVTRVALGAVDAPVLVIAGDLDWIASPAVAGEFGGLFPDGRVVVLPGAGHYPWLDDAAGFGSAVADFLG